MLKRKRIYQCIEKLKKLYHYLKDLRKELKLLEAHAEGISTTWLVNKVFTFCQMYSEITFYPYQKQFSKRLIRSVLENDGNEITALFARQTGKLVY